MPKDPQYNDAATPMLRQYLRIKADHPDAILMFRLGDFYEMFFEDAILASNILNITLTSRNRNDPNPIPLCGVPYHSVEPYIARLLESGRKVAICDQVEDPRLAKGVVKRQVTRVVTPGVVADGPLLEEKGLNLLASLCRAGDGFGLCVADVSTGLFEAEEYASGEELMAELQRREPREILLPGEISGDAAFMAKTSRLFPSVAFSVSPEPDLSALSGLEGGRALLGSRPAAARAAAAALSYMATTQRSALPHIRAVSPCSGGKFMRMDEATKRNLELVKGMRDGGRRGSLLGALDRTRTALGARKLKGWILAPLIDPAEINERLSAVEALLSDSGRLGRLGEALGGIGDIERITSRAAMNLAGARDLAALSSSLSAVAFIRDELSRGGDSLSKFAAALDAHEELSRRISARLVDDPPASLREGGVIRDGFSPELDSLRAISSDSKDFIAGLEAKEREATGIGSLKIRFNRVFGYYLEVTNAHRAKVPAHYIRKQTLSGAERYVTPELKEQEERILGAEEKSRRLELALFEELRSEVGRASATLLPTAEAVGRIDALYSLASVAAEADYRKPEVDGGDAIEIRDGRHPIVERQNPNERFVPNDLLVGGEAGRLLMITGPNMAGKSTVMRQTALIVLMAQMGSFVPASKARIGVADRIFTRVGASDALSEGQSTFMVEMSEAATILREATRKSLVVIDEIGRGTSTFDGLSIAWAVAEDLHDRVGARTLFATHYHELTDLALEKEGVRNMQIAVKEWNGEVIFLRRLVPGAISRSYGIQVARLAGLPAKVIERAGEVLANLESGELDEVGMPRIAGRSPAAAQGEPAQFGLFTHALPHEAVKLLSETDVDRTTPFDALRILRELKGTL